MDFCVAALCNLGYTMCGSYIEQVCPPCLKALSMLIFSIRCSFKAKSMFVLPKVFRAVWFWMWFVDLSCLLRLLGRFFISQNPVAVHTFSWQFTPTRLVGQASDAVSVRRAGLNKCFCMTVTNWNSWSVVPVWASLQQCSWSVVPVWGSLR